MIQIIASSVPVEFFAAKTVHGHGVVFAYGNCIGVVLNNGVVYKRLHYSIGGLGHKLDITLADLSSQEAVLNAVECSEREWMAVEDVVANQNYPPPPPQIEGENSGDISETTAE